GVQAVAQSNNSVALGSRAQTGYGQEYSVAVGSDAQTNGTQAIALGSQVQANAANALAVGNNGTSALGQSSIAIGDGALVRSGASNSIAMGRQSTIEGNVAGALALGAGASVASGANGGIALGSDSIANRGNALSVGSASSTRQIVNVSAGTQSTDAVNVSQLQGVTNAIGGGAGVGSDGSVIAPTYTIGGQPYHNVGDALDALDANGGGSNPLAVTYDSAAKDKLTLGGTGSTTPVTLTNVAAGTADTDAVNVGQLKDSGLVGDDGSGNLTSLAVAYDSAAKDRVTLGGATATTPVTLTNVATGAVNATSSDAINGSQLYATAKSTADALGGGSTVNADGAISAPSYTVGGMPVSNVGDAITNLDGRVTSNTTNITTIQNQLADTGLVDPTTGKAVAAVTYDRNTDGTTNYNSVTLGGANATGLVALHNVAAGTADTDAVNVGQLKDSGLIGDDGNGNLTSLAVAYDDATKSKATLAGANGTTLTNVAAGAVNATSSDAINGSQLYSSMQSVANTLGGGTAVDPNGNLIGTSFEVNGHPYSTVESAIQAAAAYGGTDPLAVRYDLNQDGTPNYGSVTLGGIGTNVAPVVLTNVADGKNPYDAVNFGQLSNLQDQVTNLNQSVTNIDGRVTNLESGSGGGGGGSWDYDAHGNKLTNIGNGAVSATSTDAVNGSQLHNTAQSVADALGGGASVDSNGNVIAPTYTVGGQSVNDVGSAVSKIDQRLTGMQGQINDVSRNAYSGIAAATALTMIPGVDPGKNVSFGIGSATYKGYQAVAFGGEARITQNLKVRAGVGLSSGGNTAGVGASYQW
ncbi:autotransporter adhesin, partial [Burkholderia ambifaria]